jgi:hypothetical protein
LDDAESMPSRPHKKKINPTILAAWIGLIGTFITAIFASPLLIELVKLSETQVAVTAGDSTALPSGTLVFSQNFEDGTTSGFSLRDGNWRVIRKKSGQVLEFTAVGTGWPAGTVYFGPSNISNVMIEFQVELKKLSGFYLNFREQSNGDSYVIGFDPNDKVIVWATTTYNGSNWNFSPIESQPFTFQQDKWYRVRVEAKNEEIIITIDGNRMLSGFDAQFSNGSLRFELQPGANILLDDVNIWALDQ